MNPTSDPPPNAAPIRATEPDPRSPIMTGALWFIGVAGVITLIVAMFISKGNYEGVPAWPDAGPESTSTDAGQQDGEGETPGGGGLSPEADEP